MKEMRASIPMQIRSASFIPHTINEDERTIEIVWTTGAAVRRYDEEIGEYIEILEVSETAVDLSRLNEGAPFLNSHAGFSLDSVLGVIEKAWIQNGEGRAIVRIGFGDPEIEKVWNLISQGIIRSISVGYEVLEFVEHFDGLTRILTAVKWVPLELSAVAVPADPGASIRQENACTKPVKISCRICKEDTMPTTEEDENENKENRTDDGEKTDEEDEEEKQTERKDRAMQMRTEKIFDLCEVAGLSIKDARSFAMSKKSMEMIRSEIIEKRCRLSESEINPHHNMADQMEKTLSQRAAERFKKV